MVKQGCSFLYDKRGKRNGENHGRLRRLRSGFCVLSKEQKDIDLKIKPKQTFNKIYTKIDWTANRKLYLDQASLSIRRSWDRYKIRETYISLERRLAKTLPNRTKTPEHLKA